MAKWADYLISGIWFSEEPPKHISHVVLHTDNDKTVGSGKKYSRQQVIDLLKSKTIKTITWDCENATWLEGAYVTTEYVDGSFYLASHPDAGVKDNLENTIDMEWFSFAM